MNTSSAMDWDAVFEEALELLSQYLQIDTSNPPGNERLACDFLGAILEREGIPFELYDPGDDRVSLRAVLLGNGSKRPLMLLNHTDVVPVERESWQHDPFGGEVHGSEIWGRGALDMKGLGIAQLMTFLALKRQGVELDRDVVFFAMADEEAGGQIGVEWIAREHPETLDAEYVLNEGGGGITEMFGVERPVFSVAVAEKGPVWLRLHAEGLPGHGSIPHNDNALERLISALARVQAWERPVSVAPVLTEYFRRLQQAGVFKGDATVEGLTKRAESDPRVEALATSTISVTSMSSGMKVNVIPGHAEATLDCRLLPGEDQDAFVAELEAVIADEKVAVERIFTGQSAPNPHETELFRTIEEVVHAHVEDAVVVPGMTVGFTDSREFRNRGVIAYGFSGSLSEPAVAGTVHGHNERVSLDSLRLNCQMVYEVVRRICVTGA